MPLLHRVTAASSRWGSHQPQPGPSRFHDSMEDYYLAKERLFLPRSRGGLEARNAVINVDDGYGRRLVDRAAGRVLTFGWRRRPTCGASCWRPD